MKGELVPFRRVAGVTAELSDEALLAACAVGDSAALGALYDRLQPGLWRFLSRLVGADADELDDLVQATFVAVHKAARGFQAGASVRTWVFAIGANVSRNYVRGETRRRRALQRMAQAVPAAAETPDANAERLQLTGRLRRALDALPADLRIAYVLCEVEELPGREAARALGIPEGTLWRRVHEARKTLRVLIERGPA
jgi:RNA polymerase sigma-70 factor (ECF subfamily)